ncbi:hypothetical protein KYN89_14745 [Alteriqipengyuania sp. NZ-12B]|uniref:Beta-lactamase n=1 Tax=Alteriqipengyuania abyssalis TaxID=2860200 RepID=A0ABS7PJ95_9SPHN|nr:hypothetical protein [Alteriqipengyuania abyssalis]MBY8338305.1 hypothetical protein [Alteriqipengyuania abyssalis]
MSIARTRTAAFAAGLWLALVSGAHAAPDDPAPQTRSEQQIRQDRDNADRLIAAGAAPTARALLRSLCFDDADDVSCQNYGVMAMTGEGGAPDQADGRAAFARGCDLNLLAACQNLADALVAGEGGPVEDVRALALYLGLCQRGYGGRNCHRAAMMVEDGRGMTQPDRAKALKGYAAGCAKRFRPSCRREAELRREIERDGAKIETEGQ